MARGTFGPRPAPFVGLERVGATHERSRLLLAVLLAAAVHGGLFLLGMTAPVLAPPPPLYRLTQNVALERPPPPPTPTPPPPRARRPLAHAPAAAAAAGRVVARAPTPDEPVDMTGFQMPVGTASGYAGGFTAASGTNAHSVADPGASAKGVAGGGGLERTAGPARRDWSCGWPEDEEQNADVRDVRVAIRVHVSADGTAEDVDLVGSASPAFSLAARRCALGESYRFARAPDGHPVAGLTPSFQVHFVR